MKICSSQLLDNLSNCLMNLKNSGDSGFEPMTSAMPVLCSNQPSYEITQLRAGQFVGLMFSRERNVVWKKCYMKCGVWNQMKIWALHRHLQRSWDNCLNCPASARIISSYITSFNLKNTQGVEICRVFTSKYWWSRSQKPWTSLINPSGILKCPANFAAT